MAQDGTTGAPPSRPGIELLETRWGPMYGFAADGGVSEALRRYGEYGVLEVTLYRMLLQPGDTVVDVGCNIGVIARALASEPPHPRVIGFEPQPDCFRLASANTFHNHAVSVYQLAVADRAGMVAIDEFDLSVPRNFGRTGIDRERPPPSGVPCPVVRLDEFLAERAPRPRLVKIDAEGMEADVLRGMTGLVHDDLVISAEADRRNRVPELMAAMHALGCRCLAALFRAIRPSNPRFDPQALHCHTIHVHLIGFAGAVPEWTARVKGLSPVSTPADFEAVLDAHFGDQRGEQTRRTS